MRSTAKHRFAVLLAATLVILLPVESAQAQAARRHARLATVQQQNALQQQQNAVQTAAQETTLLVQFANRRLAQVNTLNTIPVFTQASATTLNRFQQQAVALQNAVQQTMGLQQASFSQNSALSNAALRQLGTLQNAVQQTMALQNTLTIQNGQLTPFQLQLLAQEQASMLGLLTAPPPPLPGRKIGK